MSLSNAVQNMEKPAIKRKGKPDPMDRHVGKRLRMRRALLGVSQEKLAEEVGLTFQQIQKYERGTNRISAGRLHQFSNILDVPITYFYQEFVAEDGISTVRAAGGLGEKKQEPFTHDEENAAAISGEQPLSEEVLFDRETLDLVRLYYSIGSAEKRKEIFKILRSMVKSMAVEE